VSSNLAASSPRIGMSLLGSITANASGDRECNVRDGVISQASAFKGSRGFKVLSSSWQDQGGGFGRQAPGESLPLISVAYRFPAISEPGLPLPRRDPTTHARLLAQVIFHDFHKSPRSSSDATTNPVPGATATPRDRAPLLRHEQGGDVDGGELSGNLPAAPIISSSFVDKNGSG